MKTITIDILDNEAMVRLTDLENQKLIRVHKQSAYNQSPVDWESKHKGAMTQQNLSDVDRQLKELRNDWE